MRLKTQVHVQNDGFVMKILGKKLRLWKRGSVTT